MRVLIIDTCYPAFLTSHYAQRPELVDASYEGQWQALMDRFFGTSDAYSHFLGKLGHSAHELVVNCQPLQQAWARENGVRPRNRRLAPGRSLVLAQVEAFRPDVVYLQDLNALSRRTLRTLRKQSLLVVGQIASKPPSRPQLVGFDLLLTSFPHYVERFRNLGIESEYFRIGFDPRVLEHVASEPQSAEVVFVGGLARGPHAHGNELLERVARRTPVEFWGYKANLWPPDSAIRRAYRGEAWGLDMFRVLARSKIALNRNIDVAENHANNMRLYEATGVGTLLITDAKSNLSELFEPGEEVVTYVNEEELVEKISHYLDDESDRNRVARAGHERTLRDHTYEARMRELIAILTRHMK